MIVLPKEILNKDFISKFKTEEYFSQFITDFHIQPLEQLLNIYKEPNKEIAEH